jgi:hypothetical protein
MLVSLILMEKSSSFYSIFSISKLATQRNVGWASLAFLVGTGVILVTDQKEIFDRLYTIIGSIILVIVLTISTLWFKHK